MYFKNFTRRIEPPAELSGGKKLEMIRALAKIILSSRKYYNNQQESEYPSDFTARALKQLNINSLSPIEALNKLLEWQKKYRDL